MAEPVPENEQLSPAVGVDIGGTKIAVGLVSGSGDLLERVAEPTPDDAAKIPAVIADLVERVSTGSTASVGIGAAGFVSSDRSTIRFAPNIAWSDEPLGEEVQRLLGVPVVVENDANAAAWGEFRFGAGADVDDLLLVTIGTGIGGGVVHRGRLLRGASGSAAEIGHLRIVPGGVLCGCGQRGCFEQYASGRALVRTAHERLEAGDPRAAALHALAEDDDGLLGPEITAAAQDGDELARELLADLGRWAGEGIASLAAVLDPAVVVIGGGVIEAGDLLMRPLRDAFERHLPAVEHRPTIEVRPATLGNQAGLVGAADLSRVDA